MDIDESMDEQQAEEPLKEVTPLRWLCDCYYQTQKLRIQVGNRLSAVERDVDAGPPPASALLMHTRLAEMEAALVKDMEETLKGHPAMRWLGEVKGVGPTLAAKLIGLIGDIGTDGESFTTVSKLWRFAGLAVIDGKRERPVKGEKLHYNIRLKSVLYLVAGSFLKCDSPYRAIYDRARTYYTDNRPDWTKGHQHLAAMRRMEKVFLAHLWQTWRAAEGLPTRDLYVIEKLGHTSVEDPWAYATKKKKSA